MRVDRIFESGSMDFAVLSTDPAAIDPQGIAGIEALATVVGRIAHDRMGLD
jgi:hypothetical protein